MPDGSGGEATPRGPTFTRGPSHRPGLRSAAGTHFELPPEQPPASPGRNPRPADHPRYWAEALAELDTVDPAVSLVAHPYPAAGAECFDLTFSGVRGARVHAKY